MIRGAVTCEHEGQTLVGTVHEPSGDAAPPGNRIALLLLNAGPAPRAGNSDLSAHLCDRLAERGMVCFRFDLVGLGDSSGDSWSDIDTFWEASDLNAEHRRYVGRAQRSRIHEWKHLVARHALNDSRRAENRDAHVRRTNGARGRTDGCDGNMGDSSLRSLWDDLKRNGNARIAFHDCVLGEVHQANAPFGATVSQAREVYLGSLYVRKRDDLRLRSHHGHRIGFDVNGLHKHMTGARRPDKCGPHTDAAFGAHDPIQRNAGWLYAGDRDASRHVDVHRANLVRRASHVA